MDLCKSFFMGRTTKDIETKTTKNDTTYAEFGFAVNTGYGDNEQSNFFNLMAYGKTAQSLAKYVPKGTKLVVECQPRQQRWKDKDGNNHSREIHVVQAWGFAESKNAGQQPEEKPKKASKQKQQETQEKSKPYRPWVDVPPIYDGPFV